MKLLKTIYNFLFEKEDKNKTVYDIQHEIKDPIIDPGFNSTKIILNGKFTAFNKTTTDVYSEDIFKKFLEQINKNEIKFGELDHISSENNIDNLKLIFDENKEKENKEKEKYINIPIFMNSSLTYPYRTYSTENMIKYHNLSLKHDKTYREFYENYNNVVNIVDIKKNHN